MSEASPADALIALATGRRRIVALTGAGISTESGIPDYRGPNGVWSTGKPPTIGDFRDNPETRRTYWERRLTSYPELAAVEPNAGHRALAQLEGMGLLDVIVTQNIDGLHQKAGNSSDRVIELHGTSHRVKCLDCDAAFDAWAIHARQVAGDVVPDCPACGGGMRSATVLFGESLPREALASALAAVQACDLLLVVGSSLVVNPAARLPQIARQSGAAVAIVNREPTRHDHLAHVHVLGEAGPTLAALVAGLGV